MSLRTLPPEASARAAPTFGYLPVLANEHIGDRYWHLRLHAPAIARTVSAGQFLMLTPSRAAAESLMLPRPMAVYDADANEGTVDVVYGVVGPGTQRLTTFTSGETIPTLGPLGRPIEVDAAVRSLLAIGRGIGTCSLTLLARRESTANLDITAVLSARTCEPIIGAALFGSRGAQVIVVTDDQQTSAPDDVHALLVGLMDDEPPDLIVVCGSRRLTRLAGALARRWRSPAQVCVEAHMACGLGYCHCCTAAETLGWVLSDSGEQPLVCASGPVFAFAPDAEPHSATSR